MTAQWVSDLFIKSMITDRIGRHNVVLRIILKINISKKRRIAKYERKGKIALKYLQKICKHYKATAPPTGN